MSDLRCQFGLFLTVTPANVQSPKLFYDYIMPVFTYQNTLEPPGTILSGFTPAFRKVLVNGLFWIVEAGLIAGAFIDPLYWEWVVLFSTLHALLFWVLVGFRPLVFPAQLRIVYLIWVAVGTYVPYMSWMMYVTMVGLAANLLAGWCPLSRMIYLLPWNRQQEFNANLFMKTFFSGPSPGRFKVSKE
jgi:hypothetical protein